VTTRAAQAGFTLVELMVSLILFSVAMAGVLAVGVSMSTGFREQRQAIATEGAARVPVDFIADVLRQASPGVTDPAQLQDAATCATGAMTVSNAAGANGEDKLDVIFASGGVVTSSQTLYTAGTTTLTVTDATGLAAKDFVVISNMTRGHLVKISSISGNTLTLAAQCSSINLPSGGYPAGSLVIRAQHGTFYIGTQDGIPTLFMDPDSDANPVMPGEPLADGVEDLQVALGVDSTTDGVSELGASANDDEWQGNKSGDAPLSGTLRAVRVTLVARASQALVGGTATFYRPAVEDHAIAASPDMYRRRLLRTMVEIRNVGGSP
jgi:prepilin-type N-terminal cleavage/methylation domain-containing protein